MKILNLYAGVGGNRRLWSGDHEIIAVEYDPDIAHAYKTLYPNDTIVVDDAHDFLLNNYGDFDFIWSSPPCQSHSRMRYHLGVGAKGFDFKYPDFKLYEEIILLKYRTTQKQRFVVENVRPWYNPLITGYQTIDRHLYWADFDIPEISVGEENLRGIQIPELQKMHNINLDRFQISNKRQVLRNMVPPEVGLHILTAAEDSLRRVA